MTDRQLEQRLRAWYRDENMEAEAVPASLRSLVLSIPEASPASVPLFGGLDRRTIVLLAAAALLAALALGSIAIGSGLLRLAWLDTDPAVLSGRCVLDNASPRLESREGEVLFFRIDEDGQAAREDDPPLGKRIHLRGDGLLITARYQTAEQIAAMDSGLTARRLSPRGIQLLVGAVEESGLLRGCLGRYTDLPYRSVEVRSDAGVARASWGRGYPGEFIHVMSQQEKESAALLERRLDHPEEWLPSEAWIDATERAHVPDRWLVVVTFVPAEMAATFGRPGDASDAPWADRVLLPGNLPLMQFGAEWREPDMSYTDTDGSQRVQKGQRGRCAVVDASQARAITATLNATGSSVFNGSWWYSDGSDQVAARVRPLLPPDRDCSPRVLGIAPVATPPPIAPPLGDLGPLDPCGYLSEAPAGAALASDSSALTAADADVGGDPGSFGPEYRVCRYAHRDPTLPQTLELAVRVSKTSGSQARALARDMFGEGVVEESIDGRPVWLNGCTAPTDIQRRCRSAVAVSVEPYFVVLGYDHDRSGGGDRRPVGRALASALIRSIDDGGIAP